MTFFVKPPKLYGDETLMALDSEMVDDLLKDGKKMKTLMKKYDIVGLFPVVRKKDK